MPRRERTGGGAAGLAFLDAMTCGLGAVVLLYMVIHASTGLRQRAATEDLTSEVERLEAELAGAAGRLEALRRALAEAGGEERLAESLATRLEQVLDETRRSLAERRTTEEEREAALEKLADELRAMEERSKRLAATLPPEPEPEPEPPSGERLRSFAGDGDRQYLTGLKLGGRRILLLVDASASMLDPSVVNVLRRRNLPPERRVNAPKWRQTVATVDWLSTQLPASSRFQVVTFAEEARAVTGAAGWLDAGDREDLDAAVAAMRRVVPEGGTSLAGAFAHAASMDPAPDNIILLTDGLPTRGLDPPSRRTVSGRARLRLFERALRELPRDVPVNVVLFPMEGDPMAATAFWKLAIGTRGSFLAPAEDWP